MRNNIKKSLSVILIVLLIQTLVFPRMLEVENTYMKIGLDDGSARFTLETKEGDPDEPADNNKFLLYRKAPPTSLTTIYINDEPYIFGSSQGYFIDRPEVKKDKIVTEWSVKGIVIKQEVQLIDNPSTGRKDAMRILYKIKNENRRKTSVGLRILMDTSIGDNKSTPFSIPGVGEIVNETQFYRKNLPQYWYSFDDNSNPLVRTQGILKGSGITTPDKIVFASWSRLFDNLWDIDIDGSKDMRKTGTAHFDGAVAQYYGPLNMEQNELLLITAYYGLYGVSFFTSEDLSLSLSTPAETKEMPIPVSVEVRNKGKVTLDKMQISLTVPQGFNLVPNETANMEFVKVEAGGTRQALWNLTTANFSGDVSVQVKATGWLEDNEQSVFASKLFKVDYKQDLIVKEDSALTIETNVPVVTISNTNTTFITNTNLVVLEPQDTNTVTNQVVIEDVLPTNEIVQVITNTVDTVKEEVVTEYVMSQEELDLLKEIENLDGLVDEVDRKYQVLLEVYRNSFVTNQALMTVDIDLQNFKDLLFEEESNLSNQIELYKD